MAPLSPPTKQTFFLAFAFFLLGLAGQFAPDLVRVVPYSATALYFAVAYLVLMLGNLIRGI